jgi:hypothetical protein
VCPTGLGAHPTARAAPDWLEAVRARHDDLPCCYPRSGLVPAVVCEGIIIIIIIRIIMRGNEMDPIRFIG